MMDTSQYVFILEYLKHNMNLDLSSLILLLCQTYYVLSVKYKTGCVNTVWQIKQVDVLDYIAINVYACSYFSGKRKH